MDKKTVLTPLEQCCVTLTVICSYAGPPSGRVCVRIKRRLYTKKEKQDTPGSSVTVEGVNVANIPAEDVHPVCSDLSPYKRLEGGCQANGSAGRRMAFLMLYVFTQYAYEGDGERCPSFGSHSGFQVSAWT